MEKAHNSRPLCRLAPPPRHPRRPGLRAPHPLWGLPFFDGFSGAHRPFFDPASISTDELPRRWPRVWKLHGSLGWEVKGNGVVRTGRRDSTKLIYPDHLKYDEIRELPYSALFERLREFLMTPDSLLLCSVFRFLIAIFAPFLKRHWGRTPTLRFLHSNTVE